MKLFLFMLATISASPAFCGSADSLMRALEAAKAGDVIILPDGNYGDVTITQQFASDVTVRSEHPLGAVLNSLNVTGATHLRLESLQISNSANGGQGVGVVNIDGGSHDIALVNSEVYGLKDHDYSGAYGILVVGTSDVLLQNNVIHDVQDGVVGQDSDDLSVVGNTIDYIGNDTMKFSRLNKVLIENNIGPGHVYPSPGAHLDFIQFHGYDSSNITIRGNLFLTPIQPDIQGIFLADVSYTNVLIEQNIIQTGMINGIVVGAGSKIVVRNNTLINIPGEVVHKATLIFTPPDATVTGNITTSYEGGMSGGNLTMQNVSPSYPNYVDLYFKHADAGMGELRLDDLRPIDGSLATVLGAANRLSELLN